MALPVDPTRLCRDCGGRFQPSGRGQPFRWALCRECFELRRRDVRHSHDLARLYARDGGTCSLCGEWVPRDQASRDHVRPQSLGGADTHENVRLAHRRCNELKGNGGWPNDTSFAQVER
jgi:hypothetical protein